MCRKHPITVYESSNHRHGLNAGPFVDFSQDSDTNPNTTESSVVGVAPHGSGHQRRSDATNLRKSILDKKHRRLDELKVSKKP